jgi:hypothetical protein
VLLDLKNNNSERASADIIMKKEELRKKGEKTR